MGEEKEEGRGIGIPPNKGVDIPEKDTRFLSLIERLAEQGILNAETIPNSPFVSEGRLIENMFEYPLGLPANLEGNFSYFINKGVIPLVSGKDGVEFPSIGIRAEKEGSNALRDPGEVRVTLDDDVLGVLGLKRYQVNYILLSNDEFIKFSRLASSPAALKDELNVIDYDAEARRILSSLLREGIKIGATDMHIEPLASNMNRVRYRVDGVLQQSRRTATIPQQTFKKVVSLVKIVSGMDISESRRPQDGKVMFDEETVRQLEGKTIEELGGKIPAEYRGYSLRTSTLATNHGEKVALRFLQFRDREFSLENLGFSTYVLDGIKKAIHAPNGVILATGPTGSGKTTTLYSVLESLNDPGVNIVSIEEPIEIDLPGINQTQVNRKAGIDFAHSLRTILRQDPDIILVGEIRDKETADLAFRAANTGQIVLSTLHTNDSVSSLLRLYELAVDNSQIQSSLRAVISQRLVRVLCPDCRESYDATKELSSLLGENYGEKVELYREKTGRECLQCDGVGYKGRTPVTELWIIGEEEKELIYQGCKSQKQYFDIAVKKGMIPLVADGMSLVLQGRTSISELLGAISRDEFVKRRDMLVKTIADKK